MVSVKNVRIRAKSLKAAKSRFKVLWGDSWKAVSFKQVRVGDFSFKKPFEEIKVFDVKARRRK